jgi:anti-sigma B factor antagonist
MAIATASISPHLHLPAGTAGSSTYGTFAPLAPFRTPGTFSPFPPRSTLIIPCMTVVERRIGDVTVLDLKGRLVFDDGDAALRTRINDLVAEGRLQILLNLRDVTYVDSCGIGVLVAKFVSLRRKGGDLRLMNITPRSQRLMEITKLLGVFRIFDSEAEAIASFSSEPFA